jgi:hypothetical protein
MEGETRVEEENPEGRIEPLEGARLVIGSGRVTFLDVLYIIKDMHGWTSLVKTIIAYIYACQETYGFMPCPLPIRRYLAYWPWKRNF